MQTDLHERRQGSKHHVTISSLQTLDSVGDFVFCKNYRPHARMIMESLEVEKRNETTKVAHVGFEPVILKSLQEFSLFFPACSSDFTPRVRRE